VFLPSHAGKKDNTNLLFGGCASSSATMGNSSFRRAYWDFLVGARLGQDSAWKYFSCRSLKS